MRPIKHQRKKSRDSHYVFGLHPRTKLGIQIQIVIVEHTLHDWIHKCYDFMNQNVNV